MERIPAKHRETEISCSAEAAAEAQHQLSLAQVERNQIEEQLGSTSRAYAQLLHRHQYLEQAVKELNQDTQYKEEATRLKVTVERLQREVQELEAVKTRKQEIASLCRKLKTELNKAKANLEVAELA